MTQKKIVVIDYGLGNLFSVQQAFVSFGVDAVITRDPLELKNADAAVLPGVGAFGDAIKNLKECNLFEPILEFIKSGKPFLGVCLGMQLLFEESEEFGNHKGLGVIKGSIKKFPELNPKNEKLRIPQISWNTIYQPKETKWTGTPLENIKNNEFMYFLHSYYASPSDKNDILTLTNYDGIEYCSAVKRENVFAMQFHPEKSALEGIKIYKNWVNQI